MFVIARYWTGIRAVLIGNSSSGIVESTLFNTPVINFGIRQKGRESGPNVVHMENPTSTEIFRAVTKLISQKRNKKKITIYGDGKASKRIVERLEQIHLDKKLIQKEFN